MQDNEVRESQRRRGIQTWEVISIGLGALVGAVLGMIIENTAMAGVGAVMGAGVGWGIGNEFRAVQDRSLLSRFSLALGAALGALLLWMAGALTGWPIVAMLGIAAGAGIGAIAARRLITRS